MRALYVLLPILLALSASVPAQRSSSLSQNHKWPLDAVYTDSVHGVTFQYPRSWSPDVQFGYWGPDLATHFRREGLVGFGGNPYPKTELEGLGIVYTARSAANAAACEASATSIAEDVGENPALRTRTVRGTKFFVRSTGSAGMQQSSYGELLYTFRSGSCLLFETRAAYMQTAMLEPEDGQHPMTSAERRSLSALIEAVVETIQIAKKQPSSDLFPASTAPRPSHPRPAQ